MASPTRSPIKSDSPKRGSGPAEDIAPVADASLIRIGQIVGVHGLRGALRFRPDNPDSQSILTLTRIHIESRGGAGSERQVVGVSPLGRGTMRLVIEGISDVDQAEALKGAVVTVPESALPPRAEHEFYYYEAIGCEVILTDGRSIGKIEEVFSTGANEVFVVRGAGKEVLVPVIADVIRTIDIGARRVTIEAVPGLLD